jgi:hypothetical protein
VRSEATDPDSTTAGNLLPYLETKTIILDGEPHLEH